MAASVFDELDTAQGAHVVEFLVGLSPEVGRRGAQMHARRVVRKMWWERRGKVLRAQVQEGGLYTQTIHFGRTGVSGVGCDCPYGGGCKHVVAVLLTAVAGWEGAGADPAGWDDEDADGPDGFDAFEEEVSLRARTARKILRRREAHRAAVSPASQFARVAPGSASHENGLGAPADLPAGVTTAAESLAQELGRRWGKPLGKWDVDRATMIEELHRKGTNTIPETKLLQLSGQTLHSYGWNVNQVVLWPALRPPTSAMETWLYVAHALRARNRVPELGLFRSVPWEEVDLLVGPWLREQEIAAWERQLAELGAAQEEEPAGPAYRLRLTPEGGQIEWRKPGASGFEPIKTAPLRQAARALLMGTHERDPRVDETARFFLAAVTSHYETEPFLNRGSTILDRALDRLLRTPGFGECVVTPEGSSLARSDQPLRWVLSGPFFGPGDTAEVAQQPESLPAGDYELGLQLEDGAPAPPPLAVLPGRPILHVTPWQAYPMNGPLIAKPGGQAVLRIPAAALETAAGVAALERLGTTLPERVARRVEVRQVTVAVRCRLHRYPHSATDYFQLSGHTACGGQAPDERWDGSRWRPAPSSSAKPGSAAALRPASRETTLVKLDRSAQAPALAWLAEAGTKPSSIYHGPPEWLEKRLHGPALRDFPEEFLVWLDRRPDGVTVELDPELTSLREGKVAGTLKLDAEEAGVDWFDLRVALEVSDVELTPAEIAALLKAQGRWTRLPGKGWRRLEFNLSDEEQRQLADLGLGVNDLTGGNRQRFHVLQLAGDASTKLLPAARAEQVRRRAAELRTEITPEVPATLTGALRPYQREGYHFLAYLSANRFGGILADDMGLGKTVQALAWLAWLRTTDQLGDHPALVVCPKSVQDNWRAEASKFFPTLRVRQWMGGLAGDFGGLDAAPPPPAARKSRATKPRATARINGSTPAGAEVAPAASPALLIINYTQLRLHEQALLSRPWSAVILDEAQFIKNPSSQTAKAACALNSPRRLALSGTPIENRLLDLWSIMNFAMPGVLGTRSAFARNFGGKDDPLARRRLSARVRPFVLRRTKMEVARDLPDRIEEEIICELEGPQATLYRAELKRARTMLLKVQTSPQLDKLRFNILTSLLRLRQICCHPALIGAGRPGDPSVKLAALLDLLEPLIEEGHKVLVFSQFVEMLELIRGELTTREWPYLLLTGQTEDRGALVEKFQSAEGASIFLVSLKAGGFGLNLTAASYVVLFDPWWNPAVENQAIDRTHRIGQINKVIAYRLLARDTIEEKIRRLQKQKHALVSDIFGEESFAKALTLDDFRFLLGGEEEGARPA